MKKLVVFRHGHDWCDELDDDGRRHVTDTAEKLAEHLNGDTLLIVSSTALRAIQTAEIVAKRFKVGFDRHDMLWSGSSGKVIRLYKAFEQIFHYIKDHPDQPDVVILVTHYEYVQDFPEYFGKQFLNMPFPREEAIPKGTAWLIDCETKKMVHIK